MTNTKTAAKTYTVKAQNVVVAKSGQQKNGKSAGMSYALGTFETVDKVTGQIKKRSFRAFDVKLPSGKTYCGASNIIGLTEGGVSTLYMKGEFKKGRLRDPNNEAKGNYSDFSPIFVETVEARTAFVEAQKAKKAAETQGA